jgi:hypothetical protein
MEQQQVRSAYVDNINQFREYIRTRLTEPGDFFQILFMQRTKDGHAKTEVIGFKYLYSVDDLDKNIEYIKNKCISRNARCYIKVNKRNDESVSEGMLRYVVDKHLRKEYHLLPSAYSHAVAVSPAKGNRFFVVDIDEPSLYNSVVKKLQEIKESDRMSPYEGEFITVKTRNGVHLLVPPFHISEFNKTFTNITVHKDAESLLFY